MRRATPPALLAATFLVAATALPAQADDADEWHEKTANVAMMPLTDILAIVNNQHPGTIIELDLEEEDDADSGWVYEIEILKGPEQITEIEIDPVNGQIIEVEDED